MKLTMKGAHKEVKAIQTVVRATITVLFLSKTCTFPFQIDIISNEKNAKASI